MYVGNLPRDVQEGEVTDVFRRFGRIVSTWIARNPPGFAFVVRPHVAGGVGVWVCGCVRLTSHRPLQCMGSPPTPSALPSVPCPNGRTLMIHEMPLTLCVPPMARRLPATACGVR